MPRPNFTRLHWHVILHEVKMDHYYSDKPSSISVEKTIEYHTADTLFKFTTDNGVFSKDKVDAGSKLLINTLIEQCDLKGSLLDMGCGYGVMGIVLNKLHPELAVTMCDVNERALDLAKRNAEQNDVTAKIIKSDVYENINEKYNIIITNPPIRAGKKVVHDILRNGYNHLHSGGRIIAVIRKKQGAETALKAMKQEYDEASVIARKSGYLILCAVKTKG